MSKSNSQIKKRVIVNLIIGGMGLDFKANSSNPKLTPMVEFLKKFLFLTVVAFAVSH